MKNITCEDDNPIVVEVFLAMGLQAPKYILDHCVAIYLPNVLAYILDNEKMEIRPGSGVLMMAVVENKLDMLEVLLSHPRLTDFNNMVFRSLAVHCIQFHSYEALQLLVNDKRCNPSQPDNDLLIRALHRASSISANILVNSPNFELGSIEEIAPALLDNRSIEDATQLLQDIPKLAEIWLNRWRACKANSLSVLVA
ncbi:Hypothetical protein POVR2_LOCUS191 [uncultured virus]|nr:Hypothetical protein POVR2_LOCUS191 [uncultured virus]